MGSRSRAGSGDSSAGSGAVAQGGVGRVSKGGSAQRAAHAAPFPISRKLSRMRTDPPCPPAERHTRTSSRAILLSGHAYGNPPCVCHRPSLTSRALSAFPLVGPAKSPSMLRDSDYLCPTCELFRPFTVSCRRSGGPGACPVPRHGSHQLQVPAASLQVERLLCGGWAVAVLMEAGPLEPGSGARREHCCWLLPRLKILGEIIWLQ
ncbi:uncharacterized protein LOC112551804 isoform X1 [Alligator sinensis]|uniref:Uncharacterized protein LOC112551804 isoform X1 n=1 Tax=Alligator sinensis TaxID=38654 RepID=A0A3Q0HJP9_ALLSI|nr:uncharacterized protein LOC112551804 isoform X1 [Alligator sinensis]